MCSQFVAGDLSSSICAAHTSHYISFGYAHGKLMLLILMLILITHVLVKTLHVLHLRLSFLITDKSVFPNGTPQHLVYILTFNDFCFEEFDPSTKAVSGHYRFVLHIFLQE